MLWMDQRSAPQTARILREAAGDPALYVNCNGDGPLSAEWMIPKALWLKDNKPDLFGDAAVICECQDFMNYRLTGTLVASACNVAARWHWDARTAVASSWDNQELRCRGMPTSLLAKIGLSELADKWPQRCIAMGEPICASGLTEEAAAHLGLREGTRVVQGGPDAYVGMVGLNCVRPGELALITGSSHLHLLVTSRAQGGPGVWGAYRAAPLPELCFAEGGQCSTGSVLNWARRLMSGFPSSTAASATSTTAEKGSGSGSGSGSDSSSGSGSASGGPSYQELDAEAQAVSPGAGGLLAMDTFQGARTPVTSPLARGALLGLSLAHTRAHVWRALLEAVCFGTRAALEALAVLSFSLSLSLSLSLFFSFFFSVSFSLILSFFSSRLI
jgi:ribulose kinase